MTTENLPSEAFDEIDAILDDLRTRYDETPQWEFCEGFRSESTRLNSSHG